MFCRNVNARFSFEDPAFDYSNANSATSRYIIETYRERHAGCLVSLVAVLRCVRRFILGFIAKITATVDGCSMFKGSGSQF